jgi:hypothetical protein
MSTEIQGARTIPRTAVETLIQEYRVIPVLDAECGG